MRRYDIRDRVQLVEDIRYQEMLRKKDFAKCIGIHEKYYHGISRGFRNLTIPLLIDILETFGYKYHFEFGKTVIHSNDEFCRLVKMLIFSKHMTYKEFAEFIGVAESTVWDWVNISIPVKQLIQIAEKMRLKFIVVIE